MDTLSSINKIKCIQEIVLEPLNELFENALIELGFSKDDHYIPIDSEPSSIEIITDTYCIVLLQYSSNFINLPIEYKANFFYQFTKMIDSYYRHRKVLPLVEKEYFAHAIHLCSELTKNEPAGSTFFNMRYNVKELIERLKKIPRHNEHHFQLHDKYMTVFSEKNEMLLIII